MHDRAPRQSTLHGPVQVTTHCAPPLQLTLELAPTRTVHEVLLHVMLLLAPPSCVQLPPGPQLTLHEAVQVVLQVDCALQTKFPLPAALHAQVFPPAQTQSFVDPPPPPQAQLGPGHAATGAPQPAVAPSAPSAPSERERTATRVDRLNIVSPLCATPSRRSARM
jgi:hypothetical protein